MTDLQIVGGEHLNRMQLKNRKRRQMQRARRNTRNLELAELKSQLETVKAKSTLRLSWNGFTLLGYAFVITTIAMLAVNAWKHNDDPPDAIIAIGVNCLPEIAIGAVLGEALALLKMRTWLSSLGSLFCIGLAWGLYLLVVQNADQYQTGIAVTGNMERTSTRIKDLEDHYHVSTLKQRYDDASTKETNAYRSKDRECQKLSGKGTLCERYERTIIKPLTTAKEAAWNEYDMAAKKVDQEAKEDTASLNSKTLKGVDYKKLFPLIGGFIFMIGRIRG